MPAKVYYWLADNTGNPITDGEYTAAALIPLAAYLAKREPENGPYSARFENESAIGETFVRPFNPVSGAFERGNYL